MSPGSPGSTEKTNMALARRWLTEGWALGDVDLAYRIFAPDFTLAGERVGPEGPRRSAERIRAAFTDLAIGIDLQVAQGDLVATHFTAHARHAGPYRGIEATGRPVVASGIQIWTVRDGLVVADRNVFDEWGLMSQLNGDA